MTETSPLAAVAWPRSYNRHLNESEMIDRVRVKAGTPLPGVSVSIRDEDGNEVPHDGTTMGNLYARGPWVTDQYFKGDNPECFTEDGWLHTADVAVAFPEGDFVIVDRTKY